jgi:hypothetical protein
MKDFFRYLFKPSFWQSNTGVSLAWDMELNLILDNVKEISFNTHTTKIDGVEIWTSNYPYAYGNAREIPGCFPKRRTRERLYNFIQYQKLEELKGRYENRNKTII